MNSAVQLLSTAGAPECRSAGNAWNESTFAESDRAALITVLGGILASRVRLNERDFTGAKGAFTTEYDIIVYDGYYYYYYYYYWCLASQVLVFVQLCNIVGMSGETVHGFHQSVTIGMVQWLFTSDRFLVVSRAILWYLIRCCVVVVIIIISVTKLSCQVWSYTSFLLKVNILCTWLFDLVTFTFDYRHHWQPQVYAFHSEIKYVNFFPYHYVTLTCDYFNSWLSHCFHFQESWGTTVQR